MGEGRAHSGATRSMSKCEAEKSVTGKECDFVHSIQKFRRKLVEAAIHQLMPTYNIIWSELVQCASTEAGQMESDSRATCFSRHIVSCLKIDSIAVKDIGRTSQKVQLAPVRTCVSGDNGISFESPSGRRGSCVERQGLVRSCRIVNVEIKFRRAGDQRDRAGNDKTT